MKTFFYKVKHTLTFPGASVVKNPPGNAGDLGSIPGSGGSPGEGNSNPLEYSCLGNHKDMSQANNNPTFWMS